MSYLNTIEDYFNKSYKFVGNENWTLPIDVYKTPPWHIEALEQMKIQLNCVKSQLSNFDLEKWSKHTRFRDPSSFIISTLKTKGNFELLTQAWCKFYECLSRYPVVPEIAVRKRLLTSLHLCEAPGAFVSALNRFLYTHHRQLHWTWFANTLNPYYEGNVGTDMIADDRLIRHTLTHWDFGVDQTGDLMKFYNHESLVEKGRVMLVTADGSVDCMNDPGEQENNTHFLHYCETITALRILEEKGTFVLKLFTMFEHGTICLMYLLNCCFREVHVFKPCASKSGNSEVYVISIGYKGWTLLKEVWNALVEPYEGSVNELAMFPLEHIHPDFLQQIGECAMYFMQLQSFTINENVRCFGDVQSQDVNEFKSIVAEYFLIKYRMSFHIPKRYKMIKIKNYERHKYIDEWEFRGINVEISDPKIISVKTGKALTKVTHSKFCKKITELRTIEINLSEMLNVSSSTRIIKNSDFVNSPQGVFQKEFFYTIVNSLDSDSDIAIIGIPLLTRLLVGIVYILAVGFNTVFLFKKGMLLFHQRRRDKLLFVRECFSKIDEVYQNIDEKKFVADILEVVPQELLESGIFNEIITLYNNLLYE